MNVSLQAVTKENFADVVGLPLLEHQVNLLASNAYSIAEASFYPHYTTRAIYHGADLVGFLMYVSLAEEGDPGEYAIYRLMVDHRHQGKGHGRRALELALAEIRARGDARKIWICYWPGNPTAKQFYASFGFIETELDECGEMYAQITYPAAPLLS